MSKRKYKPGDVDEFSKDEEVKKYKPPKRFIAVRGLSFDQFKARLRPGDEIPLEYLEDPLTDFEGLLSKGAIKEV